MRQGPRHDRHSPSFPDKGELRISDVDRNFMSGEGTTLSLDLVNFVISLDNEFETQVLFQTSLRLPGPQMEYGNLRRYRGSSKGQRGTK